MLASDCAGQGVTLYALTDKEHPAAKAGRYVRAAGIVLGKEVDRRTAAAEAKAAAAPPPPPPPPPVDTNTFVARWIFRLFVVSLVVLGLSLLHFDQLLPEGEGQTILRLSLAAVLSFSALVLLTNWKQGNERIGQRLLNRMWGPRTAVTKRERFFARAVRDVLTLVGIGFLAAAVYQLLVATIGM
jgi:hypothetical protein